MATRRQTQVADEIQQIVAFLLLRELKDPRFGFATITRVEVSADLKYSRIYVSVLGPPEEQKATMAAFESSKGFIRREIAGRMHTRTVPELQFRLDTSAEYSDRINRLLNELKDADAARADEPAIEDSDAEDTEDTQTGETGVGSSDQEGEPEEGR